MYCINFPFCPQLGEHCSELKDIHLGQCYSITDEGMVALARGCPKLQRLYLQENKMVSPTLSYSVLCFSTCLPQGFGYVFLLARHRNSVNSIVVRILSGHVALSLPFTVTAMLESKNYLRKNCSELYKYIFFY